MISLKLLMCRICGGDALCSNEVAHTGSGSKGRAAGVGREGLESGMTGPLAFPNKILLDGYMRMLSRWDCMIHHGVVCSGNQAVLATCAS